MVLQLCGCASTPLPPSAALSPRPAHSATSEYMAGMQLSLVGFNAAVKPMFACCCLQSLEREIADFSKDRDKRVKAAQAKLKAAKQVGVRMGGWVLLSFTQCRLRAGRGGSLTAQVMFSGANGEGQHVALG